MGTNRSIVFPGYSDAAAADYGARTAQAFGEIGYSLPFGNLAVEPFAQLARVRHDSDGFSETGGPAALRVAKAQDDVTYTTLGLHAAQSLTLSDDRAATARGMLGWRHAMGEIVPRATNGVVSSTTTFDVMGVPIAKDALVLDAGLDIKIAERVTLGFTYNAQLSAEAHDNGLRADLTWRF